MERVGRVEVEVEVGSLQLVDFDSSLQVEADNLQLAESESSREVEAGIQQFLEFVVLADGQLMGRD